MKTRKKESRWSKILPFVLFTLFALCVITVLIAGAKIYKSFTSRDLSSYDHRTISRYLTTRIHQSDARGAYFVGDFADATPKAEGDTFYFCENLDGKVYYTRIYCFDGYLYELFSVSDDSFAPEDGERILPVDDLKFLVADNTVTVKVRYADGESQTIYVNMRNKTEK